MYLCNHFSLLSLFNLVIYLFGLIYSGLIIVVCKVLLTMNCPGFALIFFVLLLSEGGIVTLP